MGGEDERSAEVARGAVKKIVARAARGLLDVVSRAGGEGFNVSFFERESAIEISGKCCDPLRVGLAVGAAQTVIEVRHKNRQIKFARSN